MMRSDILCSVMALALGAALPAAAQSQGKQVYRCPGPPVLYTDAVSMQEARDKGCKAIEAAPVTVVHGVNPPGGGGNAKPAAAGAGGGNSKAAEAPKADPQRQAEARVETTAQRQRDSDAKRILETELKREEEKLAALSKEYNNGEPERRGDERNYAKYAERVAEMKAGLARKESDIAAIKRELNKLGQ